MVGHRSDEKYSHSDEKNSRSDEKYSRFRREIFSFVREKLSFVRENNCFGFQFDPCRLSLYAILSIQRLILPETALFSV